MTNSETTKHLAKRAETAIRQAVELAGSRAHIMATTAVDQVTKEHMLSLLGIENGGKWHPGTWKLRDYGNAPLKAQLLNGLDGKASDLLGKLLVGVNLTLTAREIKAIQRSYQQLYKRELLRAIGKAAEELVAAHVARDAEALCKKSLGELLYKETDE